MKLILLSAVLAGAGWAAKTEIEQRYENFPPCSRPSNEPSEDASCTTATTDPDNWFMKGQDTMAAAYKDLAEMKAKVKKPKPCCGCRSQLERACPTRHHHSQRHDGEWMKAMSDGMASDGACHYVLRPEWWQED